MPLVYQQDINATTRLGVWHIREEESFFLRQVQLSRDINHPQKRLQHLAGRLLLKELFPSFPLELIRVADTRRPFLADEQYHFSLSHAGQYAAAIVSTKHRVGVDIELPQEKIHRIAYKFLSDPELRLIQQWPIDETQRLTLAWSMKESLFKWYGQPAIDFRQHMVIEETGMERGQFYASCLLTKGSRRHLLVRGQDMHGYMLSHVLS